MENIIQATTNKLSLKMREWIDQEIDKLVPRWLQILAMKDKTNIIKKLIGIHLEQKCYQDNPLKITISVYKHKKIISRANFEIKFKGEK